MIFSFDAVHITSIAGKLLHLKIILFYMQKNTLRRVIFHNHDFFALVFQNDSNANENQYYKPINIDSHAQNKIS